MTILMETTNLRFRAFEAADAPLAFNWLTDAEMMRYMPTGPDYTMAQVEARLARYIAHQERHGFSRWLMFDRATGEPVGDSGMLVLPETGEIELGYRVLRPWRGKGLATEATRAWLQHAFDHVGLSEVIAFSHPDNLPSIRVMEKSGFRFLREDEVAGMKVKVYVNRRPG